MGGGVGVLGPAESPPPPPCSLNASNPTRSPQSPTSGAGGLIVVLVLLCLAESRYQGCTTQSNADSGGLRESKGAGLWTSRHRDGGGRHNGGSRREGRAPKGGLSAAVTGIGTASGAGRAYAHFWEGERVWGFFTAI